jgi:hypothetical protein
MQFHILHLRHRLYILRLVSCFFFSQNSLIKRLIRVEMNLIREVYVLSEVMNSMCLMFFNILHSQLLILIADRSNFCLFKSCNSRRTLTECSLNCTRRNIQVKMLNLHRSRLISHEIFSRIKHLIHHVSDYLLESIITKFFKTTKSCLIKTISLLQSKFFCVVIDVFSFADVFYDDITSSIINDMKKASSSNSVCLLTLIFER